MNSRTIISLLLLGSLLCAGPLACSHLMPAQHTGTSATSPATLRLVYRIAPKDAATVSPELAERTRTIVAERLAATGHENCTVSIQRKDLLDVDLPAPADRDAIDRLIRAEGVLSVYIVSSAEYQTPAAIAQIEAAAAKSGERPPRIVLSTDTPEHSELAVENVAGSCIVGLHVTSADVSTDQQGSPAVMFELGNTDARAFGDLTGDHVGKRMALALDGRALMSPTIRSRIASRGMITGSLKPTDAKTLAAILKEGPLPAHLELLTVNEIGH